MRNFIIALVLIMVIPFGAFGQELKGIDEIAPFSEGLAAVRQGEQWGFINEEGTLVIPFRKDVYWNKDAETSRSDVLGVGYPMFHDGLCLTSTTVEDGIPLFGFMDTKGKVVIEPQFLNIYPFKDGYTTGVLFEKTLKGQNEFNLNIFEFKFFDVLVDTSGEVVEFFNRRQNIQMTKKRYQTPAIQAKRLTKDLVAVYTQDKGWEIRKITLDN